MRKVILGIFLAMFFVLLYLYNKDRKNEKMILQENSALIQQQVRNVGKLVVTEGHFSEVFTYKNSKAILGDLIEVEKKALVVVNADVTIAYDLSQIETEIDQDSKTLRLLKIPKEEIKINPDFEYYDIQADYLNQFDATDYNKIKKTVNKQLLKKIELSDLKSNAQNRLLSELAKFYILTNSLGWTLEYNQMPIENIEELELIQ
ncbi:MAG: DUF4230 domain-containing protein [Bacteroidota bacterium]